jgi:hypothetical protein
MNRIKNRISCLSLVRKKYGFSAGANKKDLVIAAKKDKRFSRS